MLQQNHSTKLKNQSIKKLLNSKSLEILISSFILILSFYTSIKADDISDFEIEGMSINESLLNFMTSEEIEKELNNKKSFYYDNKKYVSILSSQEIYE